MDYEEGKMINLLRTIKRNHLSYGGGESRFWKIILLKLLWQTRLSRRKSLSEEFIDYETRFNRDGFVIIKNKYIKEADYINQTIENNQIEKNKIIRNVHDSDKELKKRNEVRGCPFWYFWSFNDENLKNLYYNSDLIYLLHNHYKRQTYCRNNPYVFEVKNINSEQNKDITELFHLDAIHQISMMLLLNDIDNHSTHMQIAIGSNQKPKYNYNRDLFDQEKIEREHNIFNCIGKKGTLILFNAGNLYHRGVVRSKQRRVLQMNFTTGYGMWAKEEKINIPDYVDNRYIKKFYNKISL